MAHDAKRHTSPGLYILAIGLLLILLGGTIAALWMGGRSAPKPATRTPANREESIAAILDAAKTYAAAERVGEAEAVVRAGVDQYPDSQDLRLAYVEILVMGAGGNADRLRSAYEQAVKALEIGPRSGEALLLAGVLARGIGEMDEALEHLRAARLAAPSSAAIALQLGQVELAQGNTEEAKASLVMASALAPDEATPHGMLAEIFLRENKVTMALEQIGRARKLQPEVSAWKVIEARARKRDNDPEAALLLLSSLPLAEKHQRAVLVTFSECYGMLKRPLEAARAWAEASDAEPLDGSLAMDAAVWFERAGELSEALRYARRAFEGGSPEAAKLVDRLAAAAPGGG